MLTSQETTQIGAAIIKAAAEITNVQKNKKAFGYKYASLDAILEMLRPVLPKYGLWFIQAPRKEGERCTLITRVLHTSGEWFEVTTEMTDTELQGKANDTQRMGASITYYRRYVLSSLFGIAADEDVDGNIEQRRPEPNNSPQPHNNSQRRPKLSEKEARMYVQNAIQEFKEAGSVESDIMTSFQKIVGRIFNNIKELNEPEIRALANRLFLEKQAKLKGDNHE